MNGLFPQTASTHSMFKSRTTGYSNSIHEENGAQITEICQEQRRLSRLYGSKTRRLKKGKIKSEKDINGSTKSDSVKKNTNDTSKKSNSKNDKQEVQKFFDRPTDELLVEIHADNYNINHPWFVGYQNTASLQGSPNALASRYLKWT